MGFYSPQGAEYKDYSSGISKMPEHLKKPKFGHLTIVGKSFWFIVDQPGTVLPGAVEPVAATMPFSART